MPVERRRSPAPQEFPNPQAEKVWWETEHMLDAAPPTGRLQWHDLYDSWKQTEKDCTDHGENPDKARVIAWNALGFFMAERIKDLKIESDLHDFERVKQPQFSRELSILGSWQKIIGDALHEQSTKFNGEPPNPYLPLKDRRPTDVVEPANPDSPIYAHLQALDAAADM